MTLSAIVLVRGKKDIEAHVLEVVLQKPDTAPIRIFSKVGVSYRFLHTILENGLISLEARGRTRFKACITERGREFLDHYRIYDRFFPVDG